jgi:YHS domain-containing protein
LEILAIDPVCGMNVNETRAENESVYKGTKYYFCSAVCREEFDRDPDSYIYADPDELETYYQDTDFECDD